MTEELILERLFSRLPDPGPDLVVPPGDDCAALDFSENRLLLIAVDQLIGGKHYHCETGRDTPPESAGRKLLARNLSDIAAMGGTPQYCLAALGVSPRRDNSWVDRFFSGIMELAAEFNVHMIGGDLARTENDDVTSLTVIGLVERGDVCTRSGARPGDALVATGHFGDSLQSGHHLSFHPRCSEGRWLAEEGKPNAMIDVSDGLITDAQRICRASGVGLVVDPDAIPRRKPDTALEEVLAGGEDYELLAAVTPENKKYVTEKWPFAEVPLTVIGKFIASDKPKVVDADGTALDTCYGGFDHFKNPGIS